MFLFLIISRGKSLGETATDPYPRWQLCSLKAFLKSSVKENYFISDSRLPCPKPTFQCRGKEPEHKWAELPWAISKDLKPSPAFKFFSLCPCGNQGQKEKRRTFYAEKKSYWISKNIFCINRKKLNFGEYMCSLLDSFCSTPAGWGWATSSRKIRLPHNPIYHHHLLFSLRHGHSLLGSPLSHPWIYTQRTLPVIWWQLWDGELPGKQLLNSFGPFSHTEQPPFTWGCFWNLASLQIL